MRVLHLVNSSLPDRQVGYTIRSHQILVHQKAAGLEAEAASLDFHRRKRPEADTATIDGVHYELFGYPVGRPRLPWKERRHELALRLVGRSSGPMGLLGRETVLIRWFIDQAAERFSPSSGFDLIHAHSPYYCATAAEALARRWKIPWVYEARGFWEESAVTQGSHSRDSAWYRFRRTAETRALRAADRVFAIGSTAKDEIVRRGVPADRIDLAPNSVDAERFRPGPKDPELEREWDLTGRLVLGYVGSLRLLEGIDAMINLLPHVRRRVPNAVLLLVGGAPEDYQAQLERRVDRLSVRDMVRFTGRVPFSRVEQMYRLIDLFLVTRPDREVTRLVTPLKPLEALASGLPVLASDLAALRELVGGTPERGALLPPDGPQVWAETIEALAKDPERRQRWGQAGRAWVERERSWPRLVERYQRGYAAARSRRNPGSV